MQRPFLLCVILVVSSAYAFASKMVGETASDNLVERFVLVEDMTVIPVDADTVQAVEATIGEFVIVRKQIDDESGQVRVSTADAQRTLVIRDQVVGDYGLSDGTFFVFFHDRDSLEETVREHGLHVEDLFANAKMARVSIEDGQDVFAVSG